MKALWLLLIIPMSMAVGFFLAMWYMLYKAKKAMGIKSWKDFEKQMRKIQALQKKMEKGSMNEVIEKIQRDPNLRKQMEELRKRFEGQI